MIMNLNKGEEENFSNSLINYLLVRTHMNFNL